MKDNLITTGLDRTEMKIFICWSNILNVLNFRYQKIDIEKEIKSMSDKEILQYLGIDPNKPETLSNRVYN